MDYPLDRFIPVAGEVLPNIPKSAEDLKFGLEDLQVGCRSGIYEEVSMSHGVRAMEKGAVIFSAFTVWQDRGDTNMGRLVVNLSKQSTH